MDTMQLINLKINLLTKSLWTPQDIKDYFQVSLSHANELKMKVMARTPKLAINEGKRQTLVPAEAMLKYHATTRSKEMDILTQAHQKCNEVYVEKEIRG